MATRMLQRRGTAAEWAAQNPVLAAGEIGFETDTKVIKIGDGVTAWNDIVMTFASNSAFQAHADKADAHLATSEPTPSRLALRDTGGRTKVGAPTDPAHAARLADILSDLRGQVVYSSMRHSTIQSIPNATNTTYTFGLVSSYGPVNDYITASTANSSFTIVKRGLWMITVQAEFAANTTGMRLVEIRRNGAPAVRDLRAPSPAFQTSMELSLLIPLPVNDVLTVNLYQNSGGALDAPDTLYTFFRASWLGPID